VDLVTAPDWNHQRSERVESVAAEHIAVITKIDSGSLYDPATGQWLMALQLRGQMLHDADQVHHYYALDLASAAYLVARCLGSFGTNPDFSARSTRSGPGCPTRDPRPNSGPPRSRRARPAPAASTTTPSTSSSSPPTTRPTTNGVGLIACRVAGCQCAQAYGITHPAADTSEPAP
jgi:hypothetical protein